MNNQILEVRGEIYITNNDHIGESDWFIRGNEIHKCFRVHKTDIEFLTSIDSVYCGSNTFWDKEYCKKIILTTNKDLIANGIQKIDEESLEYLKQNQNSENVKVDLVAVNEFGSEIRVGGYGFVKFVYKIIIPKKESTISEEAKQRAKNYMSLKGALDSHYVDFSNPNADKISFASTTNAKQETLEEAVENYAKKIWGVYFNDIHPDVAITKTQGEISIQDFIEGAKWQQERMYSEEDLKEAFKGGNKMCWTDISQETQEPYYYNFNEWFNQFKKK